MANFTKFNSVHLNSIGKILGKSINSVADVKGIRGASAGPIATSKGLFSWGRNNYGQLGQNDTTNRSSPVQVGSDTDWEDVAGGNNYPLATKSDGTLWTWGYNDYGQLGQGDITHRSSPVQVGSDTDWENVYCGNRYTLATKSDGTLWAWGNNDFGQLGQGDVTYRSSPVQVGSDTDWEDVAGGGYFQTIATKSNGTLWAWGSNHYGQLGQSDMIHRSSPVQIGSDADWENVADGSGSHTLAIKS